jgi:hypothetical protein
LLGVVYPAAFRREERGRGPRAAAGQHRSRAGASPELQASCKPVVSLLQACLKLPPSLSHPVPRPSAGATLPLNGVAPSKDRLHSIDCGRVAVVTRNRRLRSCLTVNGMHGNGCVDATQSRISCHPPTMPSLRPPRPVRGGGLVRGQEALSGQGKGTHRRHAQGGAQSRKC